MTNEITIEVERFLLIAFCRAGETGAYSVGIEEFENIGKSPEIILRHSSNIEVVIQWNDG